MPTLVMFAVCEKVIFDQRGGVPTLVGVLQGLQVRRKNGPSGSEEVPPPNAVAPKPWSAFTWWRAQPADEGKTFHQLIDLVYPDGTSTFGKQHLTFTFVEPNQRNSMESIGFPVGQEGIYIVKIWLESDSGEKVGEDHAYELTV